MLEPYAKGSGGLTAPAEVKPRIARQQAATKHGAAASWYSNLTRDRYE
jgi:hypothetical protein